MDYLDSLVSFGEWLRQRREGLGLTRAELADCAACSVSGLRKIEADERRPSRQLAELLAACLSIPTEEQAPFVEAARGHRPVARLGRPAPVAVPQPFPARSVSPGPSAARPPPQSAWNLPLPAAPLLGREAELATLAQLLGDPTCRLLTLVGPGGIGKTQLALAAAWNVGAHFADGVFFASLAGTSSPEFIVPAIALAVGLSFSSEDDPRTQLVNFLRNKQALLVLDNLEHLLAGLEEVVALLAYTTNLKLLATSRERLALSGEWVFEVQGLPVPSEGEVAGVEKYSAVRLFLQRARRARVDFELGGGDHLDVVRICRLVEGMPLAIELAASWVTVLSCAEIAGEIENGLDILTTRLRDVPARQRSLRAVFEHSWQLLTEEEQRVMRQLAVFRGGFTRAAAEGLAGATLAMLSSLVAKSLVRRASERHYDLHPLIRQCAAEKLALSGDHDLLVTAHSRHYLGGLRDLEVDIKGRRQLEALEEIEGDIENIRAAWKWAVAEGDVAAIDQSLETLYLFFDMRSRQREGAALLQLAEQKVATADRSGWARLVIRRNILCCTYRRPHAEIEAFIREALDIAQQSGNMPEVALARFALGAYYAQCRNDFADAIPLFEESLATFEAENDPFYTTRTLALIGVCKIATSGQYVFFDYIRRSLALAEAHGNKVDAVRALHNLSSGAIAHGRYSAAGEGLEQVIELAAEPGDRGRVALSSANVSVLQFLKGDFTGALTTARSSLALAREVNSSAAESFSLAVLGMLAAVTGDYPVALQAAQESRQIPSSLAAHWLARLAVAMTASALKDFATARQELRYLFQTAIQARWTAMMAWPLPVAAFVLAHEQQAPRSVELLALASTHPHTATGWLEGWSLVAELRARLAAELGDELYQLAWQRGQELELEVVILELLADQLGGEESEGNHHEKA